MLCTNGFELPYKKKKKRCQLVLYILSVKMALSKRTVAFALFFFVFIIMASQTVSSCRRVACRRRGFRSCHGVVHNCPPTCPETCKMDCRTCKPVCYCDKPGSMCDDPRLVGGDGVTFYFHGHKDEDFCLVSDSNLHINGHFIGKRGEGMKRDFTWVQSIGVLFGEHKLFIGAKKVAQWNEAMDHLALAFDGEPIVLPTTEEAQWSSSSSLVTIARLEKTNEVVVEAPNNFQITAKVVPIGKEESRIHGYNITDDDCFAHLDLTFRFYSLHGDVAGVLGQTYADNYQSRAKLGAKMPVLGGDREFSSSSIFAADCAVSRFKGSIDQGIMIGATDHHEDHLQCKAGARGWICNK